VIAELHGKMLEEGRVDRDEVHSHILPAEPQLRSRILLTGRGRQCNEVLILVPSALPYKATVLALGEYEFHSAKIADIRSQEGLDDQDRAPLPAQVSA
jgi:hypothetical protein